MDKGQAHASSGLYGTSATQTKLSVVPRLMAEADSRRLAAGLLRAKFVWLLKPPSGVLHGTRPSDSSPCHCSNSWRTR
jgi:hypothetical protein